jgi:class 3 adenylate cyclase
MPPVRRLTAILAADVAGYSRLMGVDEEGTHERLKAHLGGLVNPKIAEHRGRVVKNTGDGFLAEFPSVVDAVRCAVEVHRGMADREPDVPDERRIAFRVGINLGDVIVEEHDIFGDGVNVAARLEALAEPGGICVSRVVRDQVRDKLDFAFEDLGEQQVKNIARPVRIYALRLEAVTAGVISRNTAFTYRNKPVDTKQIGRELGVRYVLEGSVRRSGNQVRINAQLIDAKTAAHLWAERFDYGTVDLFALQNEVTSRLANALGVELIAAEAARPTKQPIALDYILRGRAAAGAFHGLAWCKLNTGSIEEVIPLVEQAIRLSPRDPQIGAWYRTIGVVHLLQSRTGEAIVWLEKEPALGLAIRPAASGPGLRARRSGGGPWWGARTAPRARARGVLGRGDPLFPSRGFRRASAARADRPRGARCPI